MALPQSSAGWTYVDYDGEKSSLTLNGVDLTAGNFTAQLALVAALQAAMLDLTVGGLASERVQASDIQSTPVVTNPLADRETKWLVRYHDATNGQKFRAEIPTADYSLRTNNSEFLDITAGVGLAYKDAFEDYVRSPNDVSHLVVVDSIQSVSRRS